MRDLSVNLCFFTYINIYAKNDSMFLWVNIFNIIFCSLRCCSSIGQYELFWLLPVVFLTYPRPVCICLHANLWMYVCPHVSMHVCPSICMQVCSFMCMHACAHFYECMCACSCACGSVCVYACMCFVWKAFLLSGVIRWCEIIVYPVSVLEWALSPRHSLFLNCKIVLKSKICALSVTMDFLIMWAYSSTSPLLSLFYLNLLSLEAKM